MAKFKVQFKLTGMELSIEGERADIPLIGAAITEQMRGLLSPAATIVEGEMPEQNGLTETAAPLALPAPAAKKKSNKTTNKGAKPSAVGEEVPAIDFDFDAARWGQPRLGWSGAQKAVWLMHVIQQTVAKREFMAAEIIKTFNARFSDAGPYPKKTNLHRDLPRLRHDGQAVVTKLDGKFILTQVAEAYIRTFPRPDAA